VHPGLLVSFDMLFLVLQANYFEKKIRLFRIFSSVNPNARGVDDVVCCSAALMASQLLPLVCRGDVYQQVEWVLLDAHSALLHHQLSDTGTSHTASHSPDIVAVSCERLSALIRRVSLPINDHLLQLQLKVSLTTIQTFIIVYNVVFILAK